MGRVDPFVNEAPDRYDTVDWAAKQPRADERFGVMGESYHGHATWAAGAS